MLGGGCMGEMFKVSPQIETMARDLSLCDFALSDETNNKLQKERKKYDRMYKNIQRKMRKTRYGRKVI